MKNTKPALRSNEKISTTAISNTLRNTNIINKNNHNLRKKNIINK